MAGYFAQWLQDWPGDWQGVQESPAGAMQGAVSLTLSLQGTLAGIQSAATVGGAHRPRILHLPVHAPRRRPREEDEALLLMRAA